MSAYTHIFLEKDNTFIEVSCTSRNSVLSRVLDNWAPWEHILMVTERDLSKIHNGLKAEIENIKQRIDANKEQIKTIATFNNSIDEKLEMIDSIQGYNEENQLELEEHEMAVQMIAMLEEIVQNNTNIHVYVGCECGSNVSIQDIQDVQD